MLSKFHWACAIRLFSLSLPPPPLLPSIRYLYALSRCFVLFSPAFDTRSISVPSPIKRVMLCGVVGFVVLSRVECLVVFPFPSYPPCISSLAIVGISSRLRLFLCEHLVYVQPVFCLSWTPSQSIA